MTLQGASRTAHCHISHNLLRFILTVRAPLRHRGEKSGLEAVEELVAAALCRHPSFKLREKWRGKPAATSGCD